MVRSLILLILLAISSISLTGCFSSNPKDINAFIKPQTVVSTDTYILQPPDEIEIHCSKVPEIHMQKQQIRPDGKISFETLGTIEAAGKTPEQVADILRSKVLDLYTLAGDKPIDVRITTYQSKRYYVMGEVERPGPKLCTGRDTTLSALAAANPTVLAWNKRIQVIRPVRSKDGKAKAKIFELNFDRMIAHGDTSKDVLLQEGDIIYVPPTILASVGRTVQQIITPISSTASTITVIQRAMEGPATTQSGP
ncbi:MAG: polysaccharide biosynthesis/export family protein [Phycisphaerae bacterium]|nr:polysaccharide biosynthesis/export family protein [Phycisphaerae bacterium]